MPTSYEGHSAPYGYRATHASAGSRLYGDKFRYNRNDEILPVAVLAVDPTSGSTPLDVTADVTGSYDPASQVLSYTIDWGDGSGDDTGTVGESGSEAVAHQFSGANTYTVTLTVTDPDGNTHQDTVDVTVS